MQHVYRVEVKYLQQQTFVKVIKTLVLVTCWAATAEEIGWAVHLSEGWWFDPHLLQSTYRVNPKLPLMHSLICVLYIVSRTILQEKGKHLILAFENY